VSDRRSTRTQIISYQTTNKGSRLSQLLRVFNLKADRVISQPTENSPIAFQLLIGPDFDSCKSPSALIAFPAPTPTPTPEGGVPPTPDPGLSSLVTPRWCRCDGDAIATILCNPGGCQQNRLPANDSAGSTSL
jgi:hypothetical protein